MIRSNGRKVIGLCVIAALSLMAFAALAKAEATSNWRVNGSNVNTTLLPEAQIKEIENKTASLLFTTIGGTKVEILCTTAKLTNAKLKTTGSTTEISAKVEGCITKLNGTTSPNCKPKSTGEPSGTIKSLNVLGLVILQSAGVPVVQLKSETGTLFSTLELGELCAIGESVPLGGVLNLKDCKGSLATELVDHLYEPGPGTSLTALGQPATLDTSVVIALAGSHAGLKWSAVAG